MEYSHEIIVPNDDLPFKMFIFEGSQGGYIRQKHWHRSIEIFAVFDGEMEFYLNDKRYPLHPGEFMLVNSNELHSIYAPKKNCHRENMTENIFSRLRTGQTAILQERV